MVKFYIDGIRVLSDDPRLVVFLVHMPVATIDDYRLLRYQMQRSRGTKLVSVGAWKHSGPMMFGRN